jgi:hypothetical protein
MDPIQPLRMAAIYEVRLRPQRSIRVQFGLQLTGVQDGPGWTAHRRWSSLNQSGRPRPELLMRLGVLGPPRLVRNFLGAGQTKAAGPLAGH